MKLRVRLRVAGVDEAGRGPLAGPVVAAAVILNPARPIRGLADSKMLEPEERERLAVLVRQRALCYAVAAWADAEEIDSINILQATMLAMRRALLGLAVAPQQVLVDAIAVRAPTGLASNVLFEAVIKGGRFGAVDQRRLHPREDHARRADAGSRPPLSGVFVVGPPKGYPTARSRGGVECAGSEPAAPA
jgi:ribonuclease HII